uniref:Protein CLP1 n=1 Tax=Anthurium amnicola TaxID=1678845 RepID=A0A1D1XF11_9ARAE
MASGSSNVQQFQLAKESELRVEVGDDSPLRVRLVSGTAEIFGTELPPENWVTIPPSLKFAIFTWHGATIELDGKSELAYVADETPMVSYVNVHAILEGRRARAKSSGTDLESSQEKLCSMLKDVIKGKDVVKLHKSGGVVPRNTKLRQKARSSRIREYFYGLVNDLSPHSSIASFSDLSIFRIGGGPQAPRSALPIGAEPAADPTRLVPVNINADLLHSILAVSYAKEMDQIISSNVAGFIYITDIDIHRKKVTYLAPCPGDLPSRYLLVGTLAWSES